MLSRPRGKAGSTVLLIDLVCILLLALWTVASSLNVFSGLPGQGSLGVVAMLFVPGYALAAVLFPGAVRGDGFVDRNAQNSAIAWSTGDTERGSKSITVVERILLAVGLSVCLVPLIGLGMDYTPGGVRPNILVRVIGVLSVLLVVVAAIRRLRLPPDDRFDPRSIGGVLGGLIRNETYQSVSTLNVLLVVGLVVAASGIGFAAVSSERGEQFTEFYILTEDPETGDLVAGEYPDDVSGEPGTVHVGVTNQEGETTEYTVVVLLQSFEGDQERTVVRQRTLDTFSITVQPGETRTESHEIDTNVAESDLRVTYLLYMGSPPSDERPGTDSAYRHTHFWINDPPSEAD